MKTIFKILFAPLLWLVQGCSPLGNPVDEELSDNHYYNNSKTKIIYSPMGNWFELGKTEMDVKVEDFEVLNGLLSKDDNNIYFDAYPVENGSIDLSSFEVKDGDYMSDIGFDQNHTYSFEKKLKGEKYYSQVKIIEGANPETYVRKDWDWAYDGQHHFFKDKKIDADYKTFEVLNDYFAKDSSKMLVRKGEIFEPFSADIDSFSIFENTAHGIDSQNVYWLAFFTENTPLIKIEHKGMKVEFLNRYFLRITDTVYYDGVAMPSIDAMSFTVIDQFYTKDANNVYYENQIIEGADVDTFGFSNEGSGIHDKNGKYRDGRLVAEN